VPLTPIGGTDYTAAMPHTAPGDTPEFYFTAQGDGGTTAYQPASAPASLYSFELYFLTSPLTETLDTDPGWNAGGLWEYGIPQGLGGSSGNPDPTSGHTGANVYGYNLSGDYPPDMGMERHLYTPGYDFTNVQGAQVSFWRWLNVESSTWDHAAFRVKTLSTSYQTIYENDGTVSDDAWTLVTYDISSIADGQDGVRFRWSMGPTDGYVEYSGWNIDDIMVTSKNLDPTLWAEQYELSVATQSTSTLRLDAGIANAGKTYFIGASLSGTSPGVNIAGLNIPLNWADFTLLSLTGASHFVSFFGTLAGLGMASATFDPLAPLPPAYVGQEISFAYVTIPLASFASNPVTVTLVN